MTRLADIAYDIPRAEYIQSAEPTGATEGDIWIDTDTGTTYGYVGSTWTEFVVVAVGGDIGLTGSGNTPLTNTIHTITISTTGNATDFGDTISARYGVAGADNGVTDRGLFAGGITTNLIEYVTISTPGNSVDFGDLTTARGRLGGVSNGSNDRGIFAGGSSNIMDYVTVSSTGNATDFGDVVGSGTKVFVQMTSNGTNERALIKWETGNIIEYITINSAGNSTDFGDMISSESGNSRMVCSNDTDDRAVWMGLYTGSYAATCEYSTISTLGNSVNFGDLTIGRTTGRGISNGLGDRGLAVGGYTTVLGGTVNIIDYITISTTGNATDFGDLIVPVWDFGDCSNGAV